MSSRISLISAILFLASLAPGVHQPRAESWAGDTGSPRYVMKLTAIAPEGTSWSDSAHEFSRRINDKTGGRMKIVWYLGGVMGDETDTIRKIHLGQIHGGVYTTLGLGMVLPEVKVLTLPNLFRSYDEVDYVLKRMTPVFTKLFREKGFILGGWTEVGFAYMFSSKRAITRAEHAKGLKVWRWAGDPMQEEIAEMQGLSTIPLALPEVLPALQTGLIDTFFAPYYACLALQWYPYARYTTTLPVAYSPGGALLDKKYFDGLPQDIQRTLSDEFRELGRPMIPMIRKDHAAALEALKKAGIQVAEPTAEDIKDADDMFRAIIEKLGDRYYPPRLLSDILQHMKEFRALMARK